jgi:hypothetical protein
MAFSAIDANSTLAPHVAALTAQGVQLVGRYLSHTPAKNLTRAEALLLGNQGIACWMVWETSRGRALLSNYDSPQDAQDAGVADAQEAVRQARDVVGAPHGAAIYFAVDTDVTADQVSDYFTGMSSAIGTDYIPGVYGNGAVCAFCLDNNLAQRAWVWAGRLTTGTQDFVNSNRWHLHQHLEVASDDDGNPFGVNFDPDDFKPTCGAFLLKDSGATLFGG